jgi:hypothetical protein
MEQTNKTKVIDLPAKSKFKHQGSTFIIESKCDNFAKCFKEPHDGHTYHLFRNVKVSLVNDDKTFLKNPDHKSEMF